MYMGAAQAYHTPHEIAQRRHAQQGQAQQVHATRASRSWGWVSKPFPVHGLERLNNSAARAIIHKRIGVCESPREDLSRAQNFMSKLKLAAFCRVFEFLDWSLALSPV